MVLCKSYDPYAGCENTEPLSPVESIEECDLVTKCPAIKKNSLCSRRPKKYNCNKRIKHLAVPRSYTSKYCTESPVKSSIVEVIKANEEQTPVRIRLLAYPKVRKLISSRDQYRDYIDAAWFKRFDVLIKKSMHTLYSRLANVQYPERKRWEKEDWERHCEWLKKRACPKIPKEAPRIIRKRAPLESLMVSAYSLSQPRHPQPKYKKVYEVPPVVPERVKTYVATERIAKLAKPKHPKDDSEVEFDPFKVNSNAKLFKTTERLKDMSQPRPGHKQQVDDSVTAFGVVKRALKAKTNPRTVELSKPKLSLGDDDDDEEMPNVNPTALKVGTKFFSMEEPEKPPRRKLVISKPIDAVKVKSVSSIFSRKSSRKKTSDDLKETPKRPTRKKGKYKDSDDSSDLNNSSEKLIACIKLEKDSQTEPETDTNPKSIKKWKRFTRSRSKSRSKSVLEPDTITKPESPPGSKICLPKKRPCSKPKALEKLKRNYVFSDRLSNLAKPRHRMEFEETFPFEVHPCALKYRPTTRVKILAISRPVLTKPKDKDDRDLTNYGVTKKALTAKPNRRTLNLSKPKIIPEHDNDVGLLTEYGVIKEALTAVTSQRTINLSKPKMITYEFAYEKPYISPQSLVAQASTRLIELAKPKHLPKELKKKRFRKKRKIKEECEAEIVKVPSSTNTVVNLEHPSESNELGTDNSSEQFLNEIDLSSDKDIIIHQENRDKDEKRRKKIEIECDWQRHVARIERLAQPKRLAYDCPTVGPGIPLDQLLPRISELSKPKLITRKYVKPIEIPFELPGKIRNWEATRKWLEKRAKPRDLHLKPNEVKEERRLTRCQMKRIKQLAFPKKDFYSHLNRPSTYKKVGKIAPGPSMRILELSVPKVRVDVKVDYRPLEYSLRISKSALAYQASERIRALACPKHMKKSKRHGIKMLKRYKKCACCFRSVSCDFLGPIVFDNCRKFSITR
ncbi:unnamed protein product [Diamesa tonsa]